MLHNFIFMSSYSQDHVVRAISLVVHITILCELNSILCQFSRPFFLAPYHGTELILAQTGKKEYLSLFDYYR